MVVVGGTGIECRVGRGAGDAAAVAAGAAATAAASTRVSGTLVGKTEGNRPAGSEEGPERAIHCRREHGGYKREPGESLK